MWEAQIGRVNVYCTVTLFYISKIFTLEILTVDHVMGRTDAEEKVLLRKQLAKHLLCLCGCVLKEIMRIWDKL